jgi:amino acid transporter
MGFNATWSMAVGGMVGGGIFSVLGVVVMLAGKWAWLSFTIAGLIALATAYSYSKLAEKFGEGGGAFTFLREVNREHFAGSLSWVLIFGYILTISVYAFTFGHYIAHVFDFGAWMPRTCALVIVFALTAVNLKGVGESALTEIITVWGKLLILLGLASIGLWKWQPDQLMAGIESKGLLGALIGAASVFMAYEGFQLLTYDYEDIRNPKKTLPRAILSAVVVVIFVYVVVAIGATMLVGAQTIVEKKEVAIAVAGREALGIWGLGLATVAAAFSTASAINATLFATARLMHEVAKDSELPPVLCHRNKNGVPDRPVMIIGLAGSMLAVVGSLSMLVEAASLAFLFTFATVNVIAFLRCKNHRWIFALGGAGAGIAAIVLVGRLIVEAPVTLCLLAIVGLVATFGRPWINRWTESLHEKHNSKKGLG